MSESHPEVCTVAISLGAPETAGESVSLTVAPTAAAESDTAGAPFELWPLAVAALLVVAVIALLVALMRRGRRGSPARRGGLNGLGMLGALLLVGAVTLTSENADAAVVATGEVAPHAVADGAAAAPAVTHGDGCALIEVGDVFVEHGSASMLPGDARDVLSATVVNRFDGEVKVSGDATFVGDLELVGVFTPSISVAGVPSAANLGAGERAGVTLAVVVPKGASAPAVPGAAVVPTLVLTATMVDRIE